jgi:hypothetical protein
MAVETLFSTMFIILTATIIIIVIIAISINVMKTYYIIIRDPYSPEVVEYLTNK